MSPRNEPDTPPAHRRHDLVTVDPATWVPMLAARPDLAGLPYLTGWAERRRPLILRRFAPGEDRALVPLGLPLPHAAGKRRIGLLLPPAALAPCPAPALAATRAAAPAPWYATLDALVALGASHGIVPRTFGALLWQALTGLAYLTDTSDLDLLWPLPGPVPPGLLDGLEAIATVAPMRLDGELILPDGGGVHWRELHAAADTVLVKHLGRLEMRPAAALRAGAAA